MYIFYGSFICILVFFHNTRIVSIIHNHRMTIQPINRFVFLSKHFLFSFFFFLSSLVFVFSVYFCWTYVFLCAIFLVKKVSMPNDYCFVFAMVASNCDALLFRLVSLIYFFFFSSLQPIFIWCCYDSVLSLSWDLDQKEF